MLELMLTRVFDVLLVPNIAYFVVTVAVFAFGLAGIFATLRPIPVDREIGETLFTGSLAFAATTVIVLRWRNEARAPGVLTEGMLAALRFGMRYSLANAPVRSTLVRAACFIAFASSLWALMPVVSRQFGMGFAGYSGLLGSLGSLVSSLFS